MKALVLTSQRSGSTFLEQCLDSHPQVRCYGEILIGFGGLYTGWVPSIVRRHRRLWIAWTSVMSGAALRPVRLLEQFYGRNEAQVMAFRLMYNHFRDPRVRRYFFGDTNIRIVHLRRDNLLKQYVSRVLMHNQVKLGRDHSHTTRSLPPVSIRVSPRRAMQQMMYWQSEFRRHERLFACHRKVELVYETMIDGQSLAWDAAQSLADLLEIKPFAVNSTLVKMNPEKLEQMIQNYGEVVDALRGTEFERFLDQDVIPSMRS